MTYIPPSMVLSPRSSVKDLQIIYDGGEQGKDKGWSAALMTWDGEPETLGVRWNGKQGSIGNPQSRGVPTWFIIPDELKEVILDKIKEIAHG